MRRTAPAFRKTAQTSAGAGFDRLGEDPEEAVGWAFADKWRLPDLRAVDLDGGLRLCQGAITGCGRQRARGGRGQAIRVEPVADPLEHVERGLVALGVEAHRPPAVPRGNRHARAGLLEVLPHDGIDGQPVALQQEDALQRAEGHLAEVEPFDRREGL